MATVMFLICEKCGVKVMRKTSANVHDLNRAVGSPYLGQHSLGETGQHEDLYDLSSINKAVTVCVRFLEDLIISLSVSHRYYPVHRWLE